MPSSQLVPSSVTAKHPAKMGTASDSGATAAPNLAPVVNFSISILAEDPSPDGDEGILELRCTAESGFIPILHRWYASAAIASGAVLVVFCLMSVFGPWALGTGASPLFPSGTELQAVPSLLTRVSMVASSHLFATHFFAAVLLLTSLAQRGGDFSALGRPALALLVVARSALLLVAYRLAKSAAAESCARTALTQAASGVHSHSSVVSQCDSRPALLLGHIVLFQSGVEILSAAFVLLFIRHHTPAEDDCEGEEEEAHVRVAAPSAIGEDDDVALFLRSLTSTTMPYAALNGVSDDEDEEDCTSVAVIGGLFADEEMVHLGPKEVGKQTRQF